MYGTVVMTGAIDLFGKSSAPKGCALETEIAVAFPF